MEFSTCGPFELLQARQLIESIVAEFAATQVTKEDIIEIMEIQKNARSIDSWCDEHDAILQALINKDPQAAKIAMWQHLENTKQMLFNGANDDFEIGIDKFMFAENPVIHLTESVLSSVKKG